MAQACIKLHTHLQAAELRQNLLLQNFIATMTEVAALSAKVYFVQFTNVAKLRVTAFTSSAVVLPISAWS